MTERGLVALATTDWRFPRAVAGVRLLLDHGRRSGLTPRQVLAGTGLRVADLAQDAEVTADQELRVVRNLQGRLGIDAGAAVGRRYRAETFGVFGYAMLTSPTVLDAINVALRFIDLSFAFAIPSAVLDRGRVLVTLDARQLPGDVRSFLVARDATAVDVVLASLVPGGVGARLTVGAERAELEFDAAELERPVPQRHAQTLALASRLCEEVVSRRRTRSGLTQDVRVLIAQRIAEGAPMAATSHELGVSERTLRRRLADEGASYQQLLDEVRAALATELLTRRSSLPLELIAARLGYAGPAPLIHAFRRWTGRTPREWRPDAVDAQLVTTRATRSVG